MSMIQHKPDLGTIVMPLVRLLGTSGLSWADRASIATAIQECQRHWKSMEDEAQQLSQQAACGQLGISQAQALDWKAGR